MVAALEMVRGACVAFATARVSLTVPWKFCSITVAVTWYEPALVGAHADWYTVPLMPW